jgi:threonine aldolase
LLSGDAWLDNARHSNARAKTLAEKLTALGMAPAFPREASAVFVHMAEPLVAGLRSRGWHFFKFIEPDIYRLLCSWVVAEQDIDDFVNDVKSSRVTET